MKYSTEGLHLTENFEGCRLTAYPDPGTGGDPWTIGYGHTGADVHKDLTITQQQAEDLLSQDVAKAEAWVNSHAHPEDLTQGEFDALVDFAFNCGCGNLAQSTLLKKVLAHDFEGAAQEFQKWDMAGGHHMAGLLRRRQAEATEFLTKICNVS
jgi:lysozyme